MNEEQRTTVVFFHPASNSFSGGPKMLYRLVTSLDQRRFEPVILSQRYDALCRRVEREGVRVEIVPFRGVLDTYNRQLLSSSTVEKIAAIARLSQFNIEVRDVLSEADVIWCKNLRAVLTIVPYSLLRNNSIIWNIGLGMEPEGMVEYLQKLALVSVDYVFIESNRQAETIFGSKTIDDNADKFVIFYKGIDTERFDPNRYNADDGKEYVIGTAASISRRKGIEYLVEAAIRLLSRRDDLRFVIAGDVPEGNEAYKRALVDRISEEGMGDRIEFLGWVDDMPQFYAELDVFVLPSLNEGIPGAVREAQAMGIPVVATDVGGTADALVDGETGLLVEPENAEVIAEALEYLLNHPEERQEMGRKGRRRIVDEFSVEEYVNRYEKFMSYIAER